MIPNFCTYILTCQDDTDILSNAVKSALPLGPVWLFDTGKGARYQIKRDNAQPVYDFYKEHWKEMRIYYSDVVQWLDTRVDYAKARNRIGEFLSGMYDWVLMLDSDEMLSNEFVSDLPAFLEDLPSMVTTIAPQWLTLWPDVDHYSDYYSHTLVHGRVYRPAQISWLNPIHEHQRFSGKRMEWPYRILHFRQLFSQRSQRQNGHGGDAWPHINEVVRPVAELGNVSWQPFVWPEGEHQESVE